MQKIRNNRILLGCILYYAVSMGMVGMANASYGLYPEAFHISVSSLGTVSAVCPLLYMLSAAVFSWLENRIGPGGMCILGAGMVLGMGISIGCLEGLAAVVLMYAFQGVIVGATSIVLTSTIVSRHYRVGVEKKLSLLLGTGILGSAVCQWISGPFYEAAGLQKGFLIFCIAGAAVQLAVTALFIRNPEKTPDAGVSVPGKTGYRSGLYRDKVFWLCAAGRILGNAGTGYTILYATLHFTNGGMRYTAITMVVGIMTLASGLYSLWNGKIIEKISLIRFYLLAFGAAIFCHLMMVSFSVWPSVLIVLLIIAAYALGAPTANISVLSVNRLFRSEDIAEANSKLYAFGGLGCMGFNPLCGFVAEKSGYNSLFLMLAVFTLASLCFYMTAMRVKKGRKEKKAAAQSV